MLVVALGSAFVAACAPPEPQSTAAKKNDGAIATSYAPPSASQSTSESLPTPHTGAIAALPDRGDLVRYDAVRRVQRQGAHTFYPVQVSEAHALAAIRTGTLVLTAPDQGRIELKYERHVEHPNGDWSWIGRDAQGVDAVLTFGEKAVFGVLPYGSDGLRMTTQGGQVWMATTDKGVLSPLQQRIRAGAVGPDYKVPGEPATDGGGTASKAAMPAARMDKASLDKASLAVRTTVDLLLGYTPGFASMMGGTAQARTRLNHMVTVGNQTFRNSDVDVELRLVGTLQVNYPDTGSSEDALEQLTGSDGTSDVPIPASLMPLRNAREALGADLVSLVRRFRDADQGGCGIGWLIGGRQTPIQPGHERYGYTAISDSNGMLAPDNGSFCRDETLIHELGHNLGLQHDVASARGDNGVLDPEEYGRYPFSFGLKTAATAGNFYTVMAYGDEGQTPYRVFSNPRITFCGGRACGIADQADNARALVNTAPLIAAFRRTIYGEEGYGAQSDVSGDFNGDGRDDLLWRHAGNGHNRIWLSANYLTQRAISAVGDVGWKVVAVGDFNGDGVSDIIWRHEGSGQNRMWPSGNAAVRVTLAPVVDPDWKIVGSGDFNADGRDDLLLRNARTGANRIWRSANAATQQPIIALHLDWQLAAIGDFNGDGRADIVWRNRANGQNRIWSGGKFGSVTEVTPIVDQDWRVVAAGDFNGDGRSDLFWRNVSSGSNAIWYGADARIQQSPGTVFDPAWKVVDSGDFNGDGQADVVWRNMTSGENTIWYSGLLSGSGSLTTVTDAGWQLVP
jgi:hypothetical protein